MKITGSTTLVRIALLLCTLSFGVVAKADLSATVDRDRVAMGDTVRLTITATGNETLNNIDLRPLLEDFEILSRSSTSSTNIVNGVRTNTRQVLLDISPRREGTLRIPALRVGRDLTNFLLVAVGPATTAGGDPLVSFEAELDQAQVYVQGQAILTLRIAQAVVLDSRSITELQLDNAFVRPLEQKQYQRTADGRIWQVHEVRYAIFPEQSGDLKIPSQTFSARETPARRRSMFDIGGSGRQIRRSSEALTLKVLPRPDQFPDSTWLPARSVEIAEEWSTPPEELRVGESATRRITITGRGLQGAQLPPTLFPATPGLKYYPDQPAISESEQGTGLVGTRVDSAALVPTRAGNWKIPELRIPWWDTQAGQVRYAVLPAREVKVAPALDVTATQQLPEPFPAAPRFDTTPIAVAPGAVPPESVGWKIATAFTTAAWLVTLVILLLRRRDKPRKGPVIAERPGEAAAFKQLLAACATGNALQARQYLIRWVAALLADESVHSLDQVESRVADGDLHDELRKIDASLYSPAQQNWDGAKLTEVAKRLRSGYSSNSKGAREELRLYPLQA